MTRQQVHKQALRGTNGSYVMNSRKRTVVIIPLVSVYLIGLGMVAVRCTGQAVPAADIPPALSSTSSPEPTPTFYATLYPYSLDGWSVYTDTQFNISFSYPAQFPRTYYSKEKQSTALVILANWDSTDPRAVAVVQMVIWENPDNLSVDSFIAEIAPSTGDPESYSKVAAPNPELADALKRAGAEDVVVYQSLGEPEYFASYQGRVYSFGQGFESASSAQNCIFELIVHNFHFLP
jgi:hypothetical protein